MPNSPADGLDSWATPVAYAEDMYWNQGSAPLTVESVSLLDPHNLILHGSLVYEMAHARHPLPISWAWADVGSKVPPSEWRARQPIPGAVSPPSASPVETNGTLSNKVNLYEIVLDISAATPVGGWALGEVVTYKAGGVSYVFTAKTGLGIGTSRLPAKDSCNAQITAIVAGFAHKAPRPVATSSQAG
jgi:hypothetical protein